MLNSNFMYSYYAFVQSYWQKRINASKYNIEAAFAQNALTLVWQQKDREDTEASQALLDAELKAQDDYVYAAQKQRAGIATQEEVNEALARLSDAREARRSTLPDYTWLVGAIHAKAQETFNLFNGFREKIIPDAVKRGRMSVGEWLAEASAEIRRDYEKYTDWLVKAQALRDTATTFGSQLQTFLQISENDLDAVGDTQKAPRTYQDIIDESSYTFTGAYSGAANHISPEGHVTGQIQVLLEVLHRIYWDGVKWMEMPDELDQCASPDLLPAVAQEGTIFLVPAGQETKESAYYYRHESKWIRMSRMSDANGWEELPTLGHTIGGYHIVREKNVPTIWNGFEKVRIDHTTLSNNIPGMHMPPGFVARVDTLDSGQNQLASDFVGFREETADNLGELDRSLGRVVYKLEEINSDGVITLPEANALKLQLQLLQSESLQLLSMGGTLGITTEINTYRDAVDIVAELLLAYVDQPAYPIEVSGAQRAQITQKFRDVQDAKSALVNAIAAAQAAGAYADASFDLSEFRLVYNGFVRGFTPEFELIFVSENELSLRPRYNDFDYLTVSEQNIQASKRTSVFTFTPVLNWNEEAQELYYSTLQPSTEYWVYLANRDQGFDLNIYDYRGRLFCSNTEPSSNYLGEAGLGLNAILIGECRTNSSARFVHELDVSLVSRRSDMRETFREFSDFDLSYVDQDTLQLSRIYGTYGQMYVPESLYYLGENREVYTNSPRLTFDPDTGLIDYDSGSVDANTLYYCYIAADTDIYNFNDLNPSTSRPWHPEDEGASDINPATGLPYYQTEKDFRLWLFLCTQPPDEGRLSQTYYGFWARHVGQVRTDGVGKFTFSPNISAIRQATLSPEYFEGLAEISIEYEEYSFFRIVRKRGTSGVVIVNGEPIQTYDSTETDKVHTVTTDEAVYLYQKTSPLQPLVDSNDTLSNYVSQEVQLYMANNREDIWGDLHGRTFLCLSTPSGGYLDSSFSGNNARWICSIKPSIINRGYDLITNGSFETSSGWTGAGWTISEDMQQAIHAPGSSASLSQLGIPIATGDTYEIYITIKSGSSGSLTVSVGGTTGEPISSLGVYKQCLRAVNTDTFRVIPTEDSDHIIDKISCFTVTEAGFEGAYITDSVLSSNVSINDNEVSPVQTWTSSRIMQAILVATAELSTSLTFERQKTVGLGVRLARIGEDSIRLESTLGDQLIVVGENGDTYQLSASGTERVVSGEPSVLYYVYLTSAGLMLGESPPTNAYNKTFTRDDDKILVGYLGFAYDGKLHFDGSIFSLYNNKTSQTWTALRYTTSGVEYLSLFTKGLVIPPGVTATLNGSSLGSITIASVGTSWGRDMCVRSWTLQPTIQTFSMPTAEGGLNVPGWWSTFTAYSYTNGLNVPFVSGISTIEQSVNFGAIPSGTHSYDALLCRFDHATNSPATNAVLYDSYGSVLYTALTPTITYTAGGSISITRSGSPY